METFFQYWWLFAIPAAFIAIVLYIFNPRRKRRLEANADIPFRDRQKKDK